MSDNELDAELLAMAGDGSEDEGELDSAGPSAAPSPTPEPKPSVEQEEDVSSTRKGVAQKVRAKGRRKRRQQSEDEDEASPSPLRSPGSSAMARSSSERDAPASPFDDEDRPLYPIEGKFLSANDRAEIMAMPEIKREEILAERAQEVIKKQQDMQLKKALAAAQASGNKAKRKAEAADLEDGGRRTTRPRAEKVPTALDKYKAAREQKGAERGQPGTSKARKDDRSASSQSDRDADGESDVEWAETSAERRRPDDPPASLRDFNLVHAGRSNLVKTWSYPSFERLLVGCFVRVHIGINRENGQPAYRMCQIKGFTEGKPYKVEVPNNKHFLLDIYVTVAQGSDERNFPLTMCSDSQFTPSELDRYEDHLRKQNLKLPTRKFLEGKLKDINLLISSDWSEAEINAKLKKKLEMERKFDPAYLLKMKKRDLLDRKVQAEDAGNWAEADRLEAEWKELTGLNNVSNKSTLSAAQLASMTQQERLAIVNMRNRQQNSEKVRRALLQDKRKLNAAREVQRKILAEKEAAKKQEEENKKLLAVPSDSMKDLFGEGSDASRAGTPAAGTPKRSRAGTPNGAKKVRKGPLLSKPRTDDEILADMDLGIDIEI